MADETNKETRMTPLDQNSPFFPLAAEQVLLESTQGVAFFDRFPLSPGHALVVPRLVVASLYQLDPGVQAELWDLVRQTRAKVEAQFRPAGFNIGINDGPAAGQTIAHAHIHVIPRYPGDVPDPRGGIRWVIPEKARYWSDKP